MFVGTVLSEVWEDLPFSGDKRLGGCMIIEPPGACGLGSRKDPLLYAEKEVHVLFVVVRSNLFVLQRKIEIVDAYVQVDIIVEQAF